MQRRTLLVLSALVVLALGTGFVVAAFLSAAPEGTQEIGLTVRQPWRGIVAVVALAFVVGGLRRIDAVAGLPVAAVGSTAGLLIIFPAMLVDLRGDVPCLSIGALVLAMTSLLLSRRSGPAASGATGVTLGAAALLCPQLLVLCAWWLARRFWTVPLLAGATFACGSLTVDSRGFEMPGFGGAAWIDLLVSSIFGMGLVGLLVLARRRSSASKKGLQPKDVAMSLGFAVLLTPTARFADLVLLFPAIAIAHEACQRSCVDGLRLYGRVSLIGALLIAWAGFLATAGVLPDVVLLTHPGALAALVVVAPVLHRRAHPERIGRADVGTLGTGTPARRDTLS